MTSNTPVLRPYRDILPTVGLRAYVDPAATVIGDVVLGEDVSIWEITSSRYGQGIVRHRADLARWRAVVGRTLDEIKNAHGMDAAVSVFPAIPVSCAVEFGRAWQPKAHPVVRVFDQVRDAGFVDRLTLS